MSTVSIARTSLPRFFAGNAPIGTTEYQIDVPPGLYRGVIVRADPDNSAAVIVGHPGNAEQGYKLKPGAEIRLPVTDSAVFAIIGEMAGQHISWIAQ
jgi:hypothetical protein